MSENEFDPYTNQNLAYIGSSPVAAPLVGGREGEDYGVAMPAYQYNPAPTPEHAIARASWTPEDHATQARVEAHTTQARQEISRMQDHTPGGDVGDNYQQSGGHERDAAAAEAQWRAWENSQYAKEFTSPSVDDVMQHRGERADPPDPTRLQFLPGMPPDVVFDVVTGNVYMMHKGEMYFLSNLNMPHFTELQRGSAVVLSRLQRQGLLGPAEPKSLKGDHGWKTKSAPGVPSYREIVGIDPNNPTLEDIGKNLSHESGKIWAQIDRSTGRAIGIGMVLTTALSAGVGLGVTPALTAGMGVAGSAAVGAGIGAATGGVGMLLGQLAGQGGDLGSIDWTAVTRSALLGGVSGGVSGGLGAVMQGSGAFPTAMGAHGVPRLTGPAAFIPPTAGTITSRGVGSMLPTPGYDIRAYQPYPGMTPEKANRAIARAGY